MLNLPDGYDATCSQLNTTHLCDKDGSHGFVEGRASMLMVAPMGITKRLTRWSTPFFSSKQDRATGNVAELLPFQIEKTKSLLEVALSVWTTFGVNVPCCLNSS